MWQTRRLRLVAGWSRKSIFEGTILGKVGFTTRIINPDRLIDKFTGKEGFLKTLMKELDKSLQNKMPLGILIDKEFQDIDQVFIPIFKSDDSFD
jgi:hypothetical protein